MDAGVVVARKFGGEQGCVRFQNEREWNGMVPFRGHGTVPTLCSVRKGTRNGMVPYCVRLEELGAQRNSHNHA